MPTASTTEEREAAYTEAIEKRSEEILAILEMKDSAKTAQVHDIIIAQYRALRNWHASNDPKLKDLATRGDDPSAGGQAASIKSSLKILHDRFITDLSTPLTPEQVDQTVWT